jgi:hypothetical protein
VLFRSQTSTLASIKAKLNTTLGKTILATTGIAVTGAVGTTIGLSVKAGDDQQINIDL